MYSNNSATALSYFGRNTPATADGFHQPFSAISWALRRFLPCGTGLGLEATSQGCQAGSVSYQLADTPDQGVIKRQYCYQILASIFCKLMTLKHLRILGAAKNCYQTIPRRTGSL
jgi:hypothetical protein